MLREQLDKGLFAPVLVGEGPTYDALAAHCRPFIQAALDRDVGTHLFEDVWAMIRQGTAQLWPTPHSATVTIVDTLPRKRMCMVWFAGGDLSEIVASERHIRTWAKAQGCDLICISGRRGWLRALNGYSEASTMMVADL